MTDNEIIKALELCANLEECKDCPMANMQKYDTDVCEHQIMLYALDLINRQKAEIERLTAERDAMHQDVITAEEYAWQCKTAKVEAIKEFAERVEPLKKFRSCMVDSVYELSVTMREIDDILKEMVGDN